MSRQAPPIAVLLLAHGAADSPKELPAYLREVLGGRPVPEELLRQLAERYERIGGKSPLKDITERQRRALALKLRAGFPGKTLKVYAGMRNSKPTILSAVRRLRKDGCREVVALPLTPYSSSLSVGLYYKKLDAAAAETGGRLKIHRVPDWHDQPRLIDAFAETIRAAFDGMPMLLRPETVLLLTAHSLPERVLKEGDPYPDQFKAAAAAVASRAGFDSWRLAYQSRGGSGGEAWLGPDAAELLEELARSGCKSVLLAPIGFVCEHLETLYDDDIHYRGLAERLGMRFTRAAAPNDSPAFIEALAAVLALTPPFR